MDKFAPIEPVKLYSSSSSSTSRFAKQNVKFIPQLNIGRLPVDLHLAILTHLALHDIPSYALSSRATAGAARDERVWEIRWAMWGVDRMGFSQVLDGIEKRAKEKEKLDRIERAKSNPVDIGNESAVDDFGDFASSTGPGSTSLFSSNFDSLSLSVQPAATAPSKPSYLSKYKRAHTLLKPLLGALNQPPHLILSTFFPQKTSLKEQSRLLHLLTTYLSPLVQPLRNWETPYLSLRSAIDRFDANLLTAFDDAERRGDENGMKEVSSASWDVWEGLMKRSSMRGRGRSRDMEWELGRVWTEKKEVFYEREQGQWKPLDNFTKTNTLDFTPMDSFMSHILDILKRDGSVATRVFPASSGALLLYAERLANEVISEYITPLLTHARSISNQIFLKATAATFKEAWRVVETLLQLSEDAFNVSLSNTGGKTKMKERFVTVEQAEDVIFKMFESNMDEYLDEEIESVKSTLEGICREWEKKISVYSATSSVAPYTSTTTQSSSPSTSARFLTSQNPAQMKRTLLASFTDVLLLPVTIVPRTVGAVGAAITTGFTTGGKGAVQGIQMLNPQRWATGASEGSGGYSEKGWMNGTGEKGSVNGYKGLEEGETVFEVGAEVDEEYDIDVNGKPGGKDVESETVEGLEVDIGVAVKEERWGDDTDNEGDSGTVSYSSQSTRLSVPSLSTRSSSTSSRSSVSTSAPSVTPTQAHSPSHPSPRLSSQPSVQANATQPSVLSNLDLLLSLDVALELIHANRESLKRLETFANYPGHYGHRVRETIEEIFVELLKAMSEGHLVRGFSLATEQMHTYKPAEHEETTSVAPLLQFFELVHIGDTIQSIVQVYFDKELAHHIDRTDFLNSVVREKKRFENALDDSVATGLNAGTEVLMNQVEHIIITLTPPRLYYPPDDGLLDLGPTKGCVEAIACLDMHCKLLKGSTSKEVLEVFHKEVGIRLIGILHKHIKRQIISLTGGFQVIADLNAYHAFISSLKVPSIVSDFAHLKMLGHVYVVEDAKDLAQIVRDVTRYGGAYRPEDIYEFIQRRADWKKIEKTVDKTMYNLSFKDDCLIC